MPEGRAVCGTANGATFGDEIRGETVGGALPATGERGAIAQGGPLGLAWGGTSRRPGQQSRVREDQKLVRVKTGGHGVSLQPAQLGLKRVPRILARAHRGQRGLVFPGKARLATKVRAKCQWASAVDSKRQVLAFRYPGGKVAAIRRVAYPNPLNSRRTLTLASLRERKEEIVALASAHGAHNVRVLGSIARGESSEASDIDLLVDFEAGRSLMDHGELIMDLEEKLGCPVDLVSARGLAGRFRERVLADAIWV